MSNLISNLPITRIPGVPDIPGAPADLTKLTTMNPTSLSNSGSPIPAQVALNYLLYTLYSLLGTLIYYPTFIANVPESTLEESLPKQDLCMRMGFSKRICKKKIKCLFKSCDYLDDPEGYKLDKQFKKPCKRKSLKRNPTETKIMGGGGINKTSKYYNKKRWRRQITEQTKNVLKDEYKKNVLNIILKKKGGGKKKRKRKKNTKKYQGGNNRNILTRNCNHKKTGRLCSLRDGNVLYTEPSKLSAILQENVKYLHMFGGGNAEEQIKQTLMDLMKKHNEKLYEIVQKNPEHISKIIDDFKKANPILSKAVFAFPESIEKYSGTLIPFIEKVKIDAIPAAMSKFADLASNQDTAKDVAIETKQNANENETGKTEGEETEEERKNLISSFFVEKIKTETLFKLTIIIKVMKQIFKNEKTTGIQTDTIKPSKRNPDTNVIFPWDFNDPNMCLSDRIKCLSSHISQTEFEREQDPELYDKCFVCKHCTLRNTASKVWGNVIKGMLSGNQSKQFATVINGLFNKLTPHMNFSFVSGKQYYLTTLISLQLAIEDLSIDQISSSFNRGYNYELKDLILGIPCVSVSSDVQNDPDDIANLRKYYESFKEIGIAEDVNGIYYKSLLKRYFEIDQSDYNEKLQFLKNITTKNYEILYVKNNQVLFDNFYNNPINPNEMRFFEHFKNNDFLIALKKQRDYNGLSYELERVLKRQYKFLLDPNNFDYSRLVNKSQINKEENLLKDIALKLF